MAKNSYDWDDLKQKFIFGDYKNLKDFADQFNLPYTSGAFKKNTTGWQKDREKQRHIKSTKVIEKITEKIAKKEARELTKAMSVELEAAKLISEVVLNALKDKQQFNRHLIQKKEKTGGEDFFEEKWYVEEELFNVVDTKRLKDLASALSSSAQLKKTILGLLSEAEQQHLDIEREKLDLDKAKANLGLDDDDETGVVILPDVDYSLEEGSEKNDE